METYTKMAALMMVTTTMMWAQVSESRPKPAGKKELHPIVIVPGSGGNQLEARLNSDYKPSSFICRKYWERNYNKSDVDRDGWYRIWFDPTVLMGPFTKCFSERMMLYYDPVQDDYVNAPGVETRVTNFGSVESLLYLVPHLKHLTGYMAPIVSSLEDIGYIDGATLYGAPYDFRYGLATSPHPSKVGTQYLTNLKLLIERATSSNSNLPAIIITHSLGGLFTLQLLLCNSPSWCRRHVKHVIALSVPWSGTVQELLTFASGYTLGVPFVDRLLIRDEQRSSESNLWMMPTVSTFGASTPLVVTPTKEYTAGDILGFLEDIGYEEGFRRYGLRILPLVERLGAPHVDVTCLVGSGLGTPKRLVYIGEGFDEEPEIVYGDGDGTVNDVSLRAVEKEWAKDGEQRVRVVEFPGVSHTGMLQDQGAIETILRVVSELNSGVVDFDMVMR